MGSRGFASHSLSKAYGTMGVTGANRRRDIDGSGYRGKSSGVNRTPLGHRPVSDQPRYLSIKGTIAPNILDTEFGQSLTPAWPKLRIVSPVFMATSSPQPFHNIAATVEPPAITDATPTSSAVMDSTHIFSAIATLHFMTPMHSKGVVVVMTSYAHRTARDHDSVRLSDVLYNSSSFWMTGFNVTMSWMMKCCLLVVLIDNCMNQEITYPERQAFKAKGRSVRIKCLVNQSTLKSTALHLYRAQSGGALQRILHFEAGTTTAKTEEAFGRRFTGAIKQNEVTLTVSALAPEDAGMYYCALWSSDNTQC
nr:uncharacterized protein LOC129443385 [Misgurnus anguillicaudatus]